MSTVGATSTLEMDKATLAKAKREKINEAKRRASFEKNQRALALIYGAAYKPRVYEVYTTNDPRTPRPCF